MVILRALSTHDAFFSFLLPWYLWSLMNWLSVTSKFCHHMPYGVILLTFTLQSVLISNDEGQPFGLS